MIRHVRGGWGGGEVRGGGVTGDEGGAIEESVKISIKAHRPATVKTLFEQPALLRPLSLLT